MQVFGVGHWEAMKSLQFGESGFNPGAHNGSSGACGLFQAYPCSKLLAACPNINFEKGEYDVDCQIKWGIDYIKRRYKTPSLAWQWWQEKHPVMVNGILKDVGHWY